MALSGAEHLKKKTQNTGNILHETQKWQLIRDLETALTESVIPHQM
jgi:hypothetical protein